MFYLESLVWNCEARVSSTFKQSEEDVNVMDLQLLLLWIHWKLLIELIGFDLIMEISIQACC